MYRKKLYFIYFSIFLLLFSVSAYGREVIMATTDYAPFYSSKMLKGGPITEITRKALKLSGHTLKVRFIPWKRALSDVSRGKYDAILGAFKTAEREKKMLFSEAVGRNQFVLITLKSSDIKFDGDLRDLKPYKIGILRGTSISQPFDNAGYLKLERVNKISQNFKKLMVNRLALVVEEKLVAQYWIATELPEAMGDIKYLQPPLTDSSIHHGFSRRVSDHKKLVRDFNAGLKKLRKQGFIKRIYKTYNLKY